MQHPIPHKASAVSSARSSNRAWLTPAIGIILLTATILPAQQLAVVTYTSENGPAHPQVWAAFQDSRGFLWLGTSEGLSRWDGVSFQSFTAVDGLHNLTVRTITEDSTGHLWIGTDDGISRYDGREFTAFNSDGGFPETGIVWSSSRDTAGRLWFGSQHGGVISWSGTALTSYTSDDGLASNYVYSVLADSQQNLWLGHRGHGLTRCSIESDGNLSTCTTFSTDQGLAHNEVRALVEDDEGLLWIGTRGGGISRWDGESFTTFTVADGLADDDIYALLVNHDRRIVIGTVRHGITVCNLPDISNCRSFGVHNGLADDSVLSLLQDRENNLWVALSNGLSQLWTEDVESYTLRDGLPHPTVYSVQVDKDGIVWAGTLDGLARIERPERRGETPNVVGLESEGVLPGHEVWEMCRDTRDRLWLATERGLCRFSTGRCNLVLTAEEGLAASDLITVYPASDGALWVGTVLGASRISFDDNGEVLEITSWTEENGLPAEYVNNIIEDHRGFIWLATNSGLTRWDGHNLTSWGSDQGLPSVELLSLAMDRDNHLWLGTNGAGLVRTDLSAEEPAFELHGPELGIPEVVGAILAVGSSLWLGTGEGAFEYDLDGPSPEQRIVQHIDTNSGLPGIEVNAISVGASDVLWLATSGGLTRLETGHHRPPPPPPTVRIERIHTVSGHEWRSTFTAPSQLRDPDTHWLGRSAPQLEHDFAAVRIDFRALFFGPHDLRFQVQLKGFDDDWSAAFVSPFKEYTNLDPGRYTFMVRSAAATGEWGPQTCFSFAVIPAWWQTAWARGGLAISILTLFGAGVRIRTSSIRRRTAELERAVTERTDDMSRYARALEDHSLALDWANVEIRHADRVKSEFLANMSHELRTPLNSIIGFSDVLARRLGDRLDEREHKFLLNVSRSGRYLLLLINNLLDLSKIEADRMDVHLDKVNLPQVLNDTLKVVQGYASDRAVTVAMQVSEELDEVEVDVAKFNQIIINLLSNAVKFSSSGDQVEVTVRAVPSSETPLGVPCYELAVTDHGPGIPEEDRSVIFEVFCQGGRAATHPGGTGLGLALVQKYVTMMGGQVDFRSTLGEGSTFWVVLPVNPLAMQPLSKASSEAPRPEEPFRRPCVLIIDHDRRHFASMAPALEQEGLLPVRAGNATDALQMVEGLRPSGLVFLWDAATANEWKSLAMVLGPAAELPMLIGFQAEGAGTVTLAADVCLCQPLRSEDLSAAVQAVQAKQGDVILIAGSDPGVREGVRTSLEDDGLTLEDLESADQQTVVGAAMVLLDLTGQDITPVLTAARNLPTGTHRALLLPTEKAPRLGELAPGSSLPPTELAVEMKVLLSRRARLKHIRSGSYPMVKQ